MSIYTGVNGTAKKATAIYAGVNGTARKIVRAYAGVNGVARLVYQRRVYLFRDGVSDDTLSGGWTGTIQYKTGGGKNYTMYRMANNGGALAGSMSGTGSQERCVYVRSGAVDVTGYRRLVMRIGWTASGLGSASYNLWSMIYGLARPGVTNVSSNTDSTLCAAYGGIELTANRSELGYEDYALDISALSGTYNVALYKGQADLKGTLNVSLSRVWLE